MKPWFFFQNGKMMPTGRDGLLKLSGDNDDLDENSNTSPKFVNEHQAQQDSSSPTYSSSWQKSKINIALVVLACTQNALFGGILYGWPTLEQDNLLTAETSHGGAGLTHDEAVALFSIGAAMDMWATLLMGFVLDKCGPRICSTLSHALVLMGVVLFALAARRMHSSSSSSSSTFYDETGDSTSSSSSSSSRYSLFVAAVALFSLGGPGVPLGSFSVSNRFPYHKNLVISLIGGARSLSVAVFCIFATLWHKGMNYRILFRAYAVLVSLSMVVSWVVWPNQPYTQDMDENSCAKDGNNNNKAMTAHDISSRAVTLVDSMESGNSHAETPFVAVDEAQVLTSWSFASTENIVQDTRSFTQQLCSVTYGRALLLFVIPSLLANFYLASLTTEMADKEQFSDDTQRVMAKQITILIGVASLLSLAVGAIMDRAGLDWSGLITILLGQIQLIIIVWLVPTNDGSKFWMLTNFVFYVLFRQFLFPVYIGTLTQKLGFKYFGLLLGIGYAISGSLQAFMENVIELVDGDCHENNDDDSVDDGDDCSHGHWRQLHYVQLVILTVLMLIPCWEIWKKRREEGKKAPM